MLARLLGRVPVVVGAGREKVSKVGSLGEEGDKYQQSGDLDEDVEAFGGVAAFLFVFVFVF